MDLSVEYQLRKSEIFDLFGKVTTNFEPFLHDLMLSTLRNTASRYEALDFLSNERKHIADMMLKDLNATVGKYHADALDIQLFHVDLPSRFESWIEEIENIKLNQQRELEERKVELAQEGNTLVKQTIELDAAKQEMLIDAAAEVKKPKSSVREAGLRPKSQP